MTRPEIQKLLDRLIYFNIAVVVMVAIFFFVIEGMIFTDSFDYKIIALLYLIVVAPAVALILGLVKLFTNLNKQRPFWIGLAWVIGVILFWLVILPLLFSR